jgi:predicted kinase
MNELGTLYFVIGKMGAGKSTFTAKYSKEHSVILISEDDWLSKLYPNEINTFDDFVVRHKKILSVLKPHLQSILKSGASVILDFPANTVDSRKWFVSLAEEVSASHTAFFIDTPNEICLKQVAKRSKEQPERAKFDTPEMFEAVTKLFEAPQAHERLNITQLA